MTTVPASIAGAKPAPAAAKAAPKSKAAVAAQRKAAVRKAVFAGHLWVGLALSVWFVLLALTGTLLVFKPQVDALLNPGLLRIAGPPAPGAVALTPDAALTAATTAYPDAGFKRIAPPLDANGVYELRYGKEKAEREVFVHPYTGQILGERDKHAALMEWVLDLHKALLLGRAGEQANGIGALLLVGLIATGIYLWWPANAKQWPQRLKVKTDASPKRLLFDLHNAFGVYSLPVLLVIAMTGAVFIYKKPVERVVYALTGTPLVPEKKHEPRGEKHGKSDDKKMASRAAIELGTGVSLASLVTASEQAAPGTTLKHMDLLTGDKGSMVRIHRERRSGAQVNNKTRLYFDAATGALTRTEDERRDPLGKRLMRWNGPLHEGKWGGAATRWVYALVALIVPLGLVVTGVVKWWQTRTAKNANRQRYRAA